MKRRNRFTLKFLSPNPTDKTKYKISKEEIYSQHSAKTAKDIPDNNLDENFSINDESLQLHIHFDYNCTYKT